MHYYGCVRFLISLQRSCSWAKLTKMLDRHCQPQYHFLPVSHTAQLPVCTQDCVIAAKCVDLPKGPAFVIPKMA